MLDKDKIENIDPKFAKDFLKEYLNKGFGSMNKCEIETLLYHLLVKYNVLSNKCFHDSLSLEISEAKVRKLIYESQLKYGEKDEAKRDLEFRKNIANCLQHAYFDKQGKHIQFAVESLYLRNYIYAKLRDNNRHADSSFNKDIISLNQDAFEALIYNTIPNVEQERFFARLKEDFDIAFGNDVSVSDRIKEVTQKVFEVIDGADKAKTGIALAKGLGTIISV